MSRFVIEEPACNSNDVFLSALLQLHAERLGPGRWRVAGDWTVEELQDYLASFIEEGGTITIFEEPLT